MAETTYTRKDLRRAIGMALQMPFYRRYVSGQSAVGASSTTIKVVDSTLTQRDGFWNGHWFYGLTNNEVSPIRIFQANENSFNLEIPRTATASEPYEITSLFSPVEIHSAINRSIQMAGRAFPETTVDTSLILEEDKLSYTISGLTSKPWILNKVYIENPGTIDRGTATAGGASTITVQSVPSGITTNYKVSVYDGTGKGQIRNYASAAGLAITVNSAWTTNPDSTSRYAIWDATEEQGDWQIVNTIYQDAPEYPDTLRFRSLFTQSYGLRIRLEYLTVPAELTADSSTTVVPKEYIINKASSILHGSALSSTRADRDLHYSENKRYDEAAERYLHLNGVHTPSTTIPIDLRINSNSWDDPLSWDSE